ncbi:TetR/AcrR family transcriptional regulator [Actinoplanes sp. NPDC051494]|uniref:TetR/AcrR family transcriptional regulator n=1 Tax=Actinoplanes sp. NPDC051494 TaxID=3363907 RepID=UPI0037A317E2
MTSGGIRDRFRTQMREEIKAAALQQLAEGGAAALSLNAIAKELGVSGPALYRYFANRDALLTELILDAYADLADTLTAAPGNLAGVYRSWALAQPHRYRLLFSAPLPGFDPHDQRLVLAAHRVMVPVLRSGAALPAAGSVLGSVLGDQLSRWSAAVPLDTAADPATALNAIMAWTRLHGFVSLEIEGNFASMGLDPDALFAELLLPG